MALKCTITTPEELVYDGEARLVVVPASDGELGILSGHAALTALLGIGELRIRGEAGKDDSFFVRGGFVQVINDRVNVLATEAEEASSIDREEASRSLDELRKSEKPRGATVDELEARNEDLRAARARAQVAGG